MHLEESSIGTESSTLNMANRLKLALIGGGREEESKRKRREREQRRGRGERGRKNLREKNRDRETERTKMMKRGHMDELSGPYKNEKLGEGKPMSWKTSR